MDEESLAEFAKLGFSIEDAIAALKKVDMNKDKRRSRTVCLCGHTNGSHKTMSNGMLICQPNPRQCHCGKFKPVIECNNLSVFKRFSVGNGDDHALTQGIVGVMSKGGSFKWIEGALFCYKCGSKDRKIIPVVIDKAGHRAVASKDNLSDRDDIFLCVECEARLQVDGNLGWKIQDGQ